MSAGEIKVCECVENIGCGRKTGTNYMNSEATQRRDKELLCEDVSTRSE